MPEPTQRRGRRKPLTSEQQELAAKYVPMARTLAKPYKRAWPSEWEEFDSAAMLALVEAAESFDARRNVRFSSFARLRIVGALKDVLRRMGHTKRQVDGDHGVMDVADISELEPYGEVVNTTPDPDVGTSLEQRDDVEAWLRSLPPHHAAACREIYINGRSQVEAARRLGCSQSRVSLLHCESLAMLNGSCDEHVKGEG